MRGETGPQTETILIERRRHERRVLERGCKVLHARSLRYMAAQTRDLSPGGALLDLASERPLSVGDRIELLVDWDGHGVGARSAMVGATIVRVGERPDRRQRVGVAFDRDLGVTLAA